MSTYEYTKKIHYRFFYGGKNEYLIGLNAVPFWIPNGFGLPQNVYVVFIASWWKKNTNKNVRF